jgi:hypothetical protein
MYWYKPDHIKRKMGASGSPLERGVGVCYPQMQKNTPLQPRNPIRPLSRGELYWVFILLIAFLPSCKPDNLQDDAGAPKYFDLEGYFKADAARLTKLNHPVLKTVIHNGDTQTKTVHINNWDAELSLFIQSDINKPAWRDSYSIVNSCNTIIYQTKDPELTTKEIVITKQGNKVKWIMIVNSTKNILYTTTEKLSYFPDSLYNIYKNQKVRLLKANNYRISGSLN